jgi:hypothetical protein
MQMWMQQKREHGVAVQKLENQHYQFLLPQDSRHQQSLHIEQQRNNVDSK